MAPDSGRSGGRRRHHDGGGWRDQRQHCRTHGTLVLHADGSYTYQSTANNITSNTTDVFVYTIKDGDGDLSTTTLTINLSDVTILGAGRQRRDGR